MKIHFDEKSDALLIFLDENKAVVESQEVKDGVILDFDDRGRSCWH